MHVFCVEVLNSQIVQVVFNGEPWADETEVPICDELEAKYRPIQLSLVVWLAENRAVGPHLNAQREKESFSRCCLSSVR